MNRALQPVHHRPEYNTAIARQINAYFHDSFILPITDFLRSSGVELGEANSSDKGSAKDERSNSIFHRNQTPLGSSDGQNALRIAIAAGTISCSAGVFTGKFTSATSRDLAAIGAKYSQATKSFRIDPARLPYAIRGWLSTSQSRTKEVIAAVIALLLLIRQNAEQAEPAIELGTEIQLIHGDVQKQLLGMLPGTGVARPPILSGAARTLASDLGTRIGGLAKNWLLKKLPAVIAKIGREMAKTASLGRLADLLKSIFGQVRRHAVIIAENEISHVIGDETEAFARALGSKTYVWQTMRDWRVRPTPDYPEQNHRALEGKEFSWDHPPVTEPGTGHTAHPGKDPGCRCLARIILPIQTR